MERESESSTSGMTRRQLLAGAGVVAAAAGLGGRRARAGTAGGREFTEWGWPLPYEKVSDKSIEWLKANGKWPLRWGWQITWLNPATTCLAIKRVGLLEKRGLEGSPDLVAVLSGAALNEGLIAGKIHVGEGGNFPSTAAMDAGLQIRGLAIRTPNIDHSIIIRPDSPIREAKDLKGKVVGLARGTSAEFFFTAYARLNGLDPAKDLTLKAMTIPDQMVFPRGIDAVIPWAPTPEIMVSALKNGKRLDVASPYQYYWGTQYIPVDLIRNVPDVAQALVDALVEAELWVRANLEQATDWTQEGIEAYKKQPREIIRKEVLLTNSTFKPTQLFPFRRAYALEGERVAKWLHEGKRTKKLFTFTDYSEFLDTTFIEKTFQKLGWKIPAVPPTFPPGYTLEAFERDIKEGRRLPSLQPSQLPGPQPWPEPGDLAREYYFMGKVYSPKG